MKLSLLALLAFMAWEAGVSTVVANTVGAEVSRDFAPLHQVLGH